MLYSIKMRASCSDPKTNRTKHISGAERIAEKENISSITQNLIERALKHSKGVADFINIKLEQVQEKELIHLDALPVVTYKTQTPEEGQQLIFTILSRLGISNGKNILRILDESWELRGAILLDVDSLKRLENDPTRGIRATYMDAANHNGVQELNCKNPYKEAIVLATKVANAPNIIGEICISDDPNYTTGYFASIKTGYIRITNIKTAGSENGGRIFLYRGPCAEVQATTAFLEKQCVIVDHVQELSKEAINGKQMAKN